MKKFEARKSYLSFEINGSDLKVQISGQIDREIKYIRGL